MNDLAISRVQQIDRSDPLVSLVQLIQQRPPYSYRPGEISPAADWFPSLVERSRIAFVAYRSHEPVGYCVAMPMLLYGKLTDFEEQLGVDFATTIYLAELGVAPKARREGIGSILLQRVHETFPPSTTACVVRTLTGNDPAVSLYERHDYQLAGDITQEWNGRTRVFLVRHLG